MNRYSSLVKHNSFPLVSKMNFIAVMPRQLHRISQMQTKVRGYRISCSPDKERPGRK